MSTRFAPCKMLDVTADTGTRAPLLRDLRANYLLVQSCCRPQPNVLSNTAVVWTASGEYIEAKKGNSGYSNEHLLPRSFDLFLAMVVRNWPIWNNE